MSDSSPVIADLRLRESEPSQIAEARPGAEILVTLIEPVGRWEFFGLAELWRFRELVFFLIWRDVKVRYKQTLLGAAWAILQPAMMMVVFTVFFNRLAGVASGGMPYPVFAYAGLLPWTFFSTAVSNAGLSVVGSERLVTKIYFPRLAIPLAAVGAAVVDSLIAFSLLLALMFWYRVPLSFGLLMAPALFASIVMLAVGVGSLLAALNVAYRDFRYVIPFFMQIWMFATPTVYMQPGQGATGVRAVLLTINPMTTLIGAFRSACLGGVFQWHLIAISLLMSAVVLAVGCFCFHRREHHFADCI